MEDDQERYLGEAKNVIKEQAYFMKKALDQAQLRDALRYSAIMLSELKTSLLSPKNYYELFMIIFNEMKILESYFKEEGRRGRKMIDLYQSVQHATNLIPRLYLLITVGSVYIQTHDVGAKKILQDLLEMIKAVQHPLRGMFVRYFFLKMCKERLPDKGSEYEGEGGDINDAIDIIMTNLTEMNKLWVRMASNKEKSKREKERIDLKVTVGENLLRLSSLEGVNLEVYQETVLPKLLELVTNSKDPVAQNYLIDCTIQTFPDEFHLATLQNLLEVCTTKLDPKVDIRTIFIRLMDRLANFAQDNDNDQMNTVLGNVDIYAMFKKNIDRMVENASSLEFKNVLDLMVAFLKFTLRCYSDNVDYMNQILKSCVLICEKQHQADFDDDCLANIVKFLTIPLETLSLSVLTMNEYPNLMKYLPFKKRRQVATRIVNAVVSLKKKIDDLGICKQLLNFINPLLKTDTDYEEISAEDFEEEQTLIARTVHLIQSDDLKTKWKIFQLFLEKFKEGGIKRQVYTYPPAFFILAQITREFFLAQTEGLNYLTLFEMMKELIDELVQSKPELCMKLYMQLVLVISEIDTQKENDEFTYEIVNSALTIYQDEISDADAKLRNLYLIIGALNKTSAVGEENYDTLASNTTQYSSKLMKKSDQCICVLRCTHLFFQQISIKSDMLQECIDTIKQNLSLIEKDNDGESQLVKTYWKNTLATIKEKDLSSQLSL